MRDEAVKAATPCPVRQGCYPIAPVERRPSMAVQVPTPEQVKAAAPEVGDALLQTLLSILTAEANL
jgi:hypothetical protein